MKEYDQDDLISFICPINLEECGLDREQIEQEEKEERYLKFAKCFGGLANIFKMK